MPEWLVIARREFWVRVRSKWFLIVTLIGPIGLLALILVPAYLSAKAADEETVVQLIDRTPEQIGPQVARELSDESGMRVEPVAPDTTDDEMMRRLRADEIDGYLILPKDLLDTSERLLRQPVIYRGANASSFGFVTKLDGDLQRSVSNIRAERADLKEVYERIAQRVILLPEHTTGKTTGVSGPATFILGYAVMFILYMAILLYAINVMRSVVEEKTSRVVEIMVSSVKPMPMMLGKILGVGSVGLVQLGAWIVMAVLIFQYRGALLGLFGVEGGGGFTLPSIGFEAVVVILLYFFLGYFFYAAMYAAIGAMVNSEQEAQQVQTPVMILLILPVACMQLVVNDPRGDMAQAFTQIPFSSPVLMPMRYLLGGASTGDLVMSLGILAATLGVAVWLAARIYRVGILMYGKRPSLGELARWIRHE